MFYKILVLHNKLTSPVQILYLVPVLNLSHADSSLHNLTLYKVCVYAVKMTCPIILFQTKIISIKTILTRTYLG